MSQYQQLTMYCSMTSLAFEAIDVFVPVELHPVVVVV